MQTSLKSKLMLIKGNVTKMNRQPTEQEQIFAKLPHKGFVFKIYKELNSTKIKIDRLSVEHVTQLEPMRYLEIFAEISGISGHSY